MSKRPTELAREPIGDALPGAGAAPAPTQLHAPFWHRGVRRVPTVAMILQASWGSGRPVALPSNPGRVWIGWGAKRSGRSAAWLAERRGEPCWRLEDGFLRSYQPGRATPPLSLVVDHLGIYYDSTRPSALESLLAGDTDPLAGREAEVDTAIARILDQKLSKYNHAPDAPATLFDDAPGRNVLVVDQTAGDLSVRLGGVDDTAFRQMLAAAQQENPDARIYLKTHPEVSAGRKRGYLSDIAADERIVPVRQAVNPQSLIRRMDRVYTVTSQMGFEAMLAGVPVTCFGRPWYAGWQASDDRVTCPRRGRRRSVRELFAAAYLHYSRYLDPLTHGPGTIFDVIAYLERQRSVRTDLDERVPGRFIPVGFSRRKARNTGPLMAHDAGRVAFADTPAAARQLAPGPGDALVCWGRKADGEVAAVARETGAAQLNMEDGFLRSVGLGSNFVPPMSLVLDGRGMYFDASSDSDLEHLLNTRRFDADELARAAAARARIVSQGLTKYNIEPRERPAWAAPNRRVVLVPGQVEDDASIRYGCADVATNANLLAHARAAEPDALIVYKPHPDVVSRNRAGDVPEAESAGADVVETQVSVISCIEACDCVHTMTSLTGFDALLRDKQVVVYGRPFYAGWGLTRDRLSFQRRSRRLSLDMLVAGALLHYPLYWDWTLMGHTSCEAVIERIVSQRAALEADGRLPGLRRGRIDQRWADRIKRWSKRA